MTNEALCDLTAIEMRGLLTAGDVSARELLAAHLERIDRINPSVNAIVTLVPELAAERALKADEAFARGESLGVLHGLPVVHKDLVNTAGVRTTSGSLIFKDHVPEHDDLIVERQREAGAVMIGKTNVPEFGAGSQTFNEVFGVTSNPYDTSFTCGGSSGGAAVALAARMVPLADGSDLGGSLRTPASFCNVVGFRPSGGRVPTVPNTELWVPLATTGPMARTVSDIALFMQAIAGQHRLAPSSNVESPEVFAGSLKRDFGGVKVAWSPDLGGLPVDAAVRTALADVPDLLSNLGCEVIEAWPDLSDAPEIFQTLRAWIFAYRYSPLLETHSEQLKGTVIWNTEKGLSMSMRDHAEACFKQARMFSELQRFMTDVEYLACPVTQVPPFSKDIEYIEEIEGVRFDSYIDWMRSCSDISTTTHPAISVPAAFTAEGLPVGLQLVGRSREDRSVLELAYAYEQMTKIGERRPALLDS
ncbi:MAG: amidase [Acidimicrobiaceae bacterium]|nr:amidase [Acidimicrobiaceae bacterium]